MFAKNDQKHGAPYLLSAGLMLFVGLLLGSGVMGGLASAAAAAQAKGWHPASPTSSILCVRSDGAATGAPCANATGYANINSAIAAASPGDEIRLAIGGVGFSGSYTNTVVDKPVTLFGGFTGNANQWAAPTYTDTTNTRLDGENVRPALVVQGNTTVTLNNLSIWHGSVVNNSGTVHVVGYGIRLQSETDPNPPTINGHFNIVAPANIYLIDGIQVAQAGTSFTGDGYLYLVHDGILNVSGDTSVVNLEDYTPPFDNRFGTVTGGATLNVTHDFLWQVGTMSGTGVTNIQPGATLEFPTDGGIKTLDRRTFNNLGTASFAAGLPLFIQNGGTFNNSGTFNLLQNWNLNSDQSTTGTFNNTGVLRVAAGSGLLQLLKPGNFVTFNNSGNIDIPGAGDTLDFQQGTINMNAGNTVTGAGAVLIGSGGGWNITAPTTVQDLTLEGGNNGNPTNINGPATLTVLRRLDLSGQSPTMAGSGATNIAAGATVTLGNAPALDGRTLNNAGTINVGLSGGTVVTLKNGAVLNNTGVFSATLGSFAFLNDNTPATINNSGTFYISNAAANVLNNSVVFNNSGLLDMRSVELHFNGGATFHQTAGTTRVLSSTLFANAGNPLNFQGGQLDGNGSLNADVNNTGASVSPGNPLGTGLGVLTVNGNYTQGGGGALNIELGGHTAGSQYDQLSVAGVAALGGALNTSAVNGFVAQIGDQFQVLLYASHTGAFGAITGGQYDAHYNPTNLTLVVTGTVATATPTPAASPTPCGTGFSDVHPSDYFYTPVQYLAGRGVISGYGDCTFRPYANTTRSQMVKIVVLGFQKAIITPAPGNYTFTDVPPSFPFFAVVETAAADGIVSGYACGGPGEACDSAHRPYFRPYANVTRGQLAKIDVLAAGWPLLNPATAKYADVAPGSTFYTFVETAGARGVVSGYNCGGPGEPCDPHARPYFRSGNRATRGQIAKIVYLSLTTP